jgi:hypothetical protein
MLKVPFIASVIICIYYAFNFGAEPIVHNNEDMKASLEGYVDWDDAIFIVGTNNQVSKDIFGFYFSIY